MEDKYRESYWDIVKGLGITAVVLGHSGFKYGIILNYYHLALFFFVAGFFYKDKYSSEPIRYVIKKFKDTWWPLMKYVIISIVLHNLLIIIGIYSERNDEYMIYPKVKYGFVEIVQAVIQAVFTGKYNEELLGATWFVFPLIVAMIMYCYMRAITKKIDIQDIKREAIIYILSWTIGAIGMSMSLMKIQLPWRIDIGLLVMPIVECGYLCKKYWNRITISGIGVIFSIAVILFYYNKKLNISFAAGEIGTPFAFIIVTFCGVYINLYIAKWIDKIAVIKWVMGYIGENSFHIMVLHFLGMKVVNFIDIIVNNKSIYILASFPYSNAQWWVLNTIMGIAVPLLGIALYNKVKNNKLKQY